MSIVLVIPVVVLAVYMAYRHVKREFAGKGSTCCDCASRTTCRARRMEK